jgi:integrase
MSAAVARVVPQPDAYQPLNVRQLWERYAATKGGSRRMKSWASTKNRLKAFVAAFAETDVMALSVRGWCVFRDGRRGVVSVTTLNHELGWAKAMLNWAVGEDLIPHNPLTRARYEPNDPTRDTFLTEEDLQKVLAAIDQSEQSDLRPGDRLRRTRSNVMLRAFILVAFDTGLRKNEILTLQWRQIDARGFVSLPKANTKTGKRRTVKLSARALEALKTLPREASGWVFVSGYRTKNNGGEKNTTHVDERHICRQFRAAVKAAGIEAAPGDGEVRVHDLRHSFATNAIAAGVPLPVVQRMTGHASLSMLGRYLHASTKDIDEAVATMERARHPEGKAA